MDSQYAFYNPLLYWGNVLESFIESSTFPVSIKAARTGKYTLSNIEDAKLSGLKPDEVIGLDIYDLGKINKIKVEDVKRVVEFDHRVRESKSPVYFKQANLIKTGFFFIETTLKKPIFQVGRKNKVIAILSVGRDITPFADPTYLFSLYKQRYPIKQAICQTLKHLKIDSCFKLKAMPTNQELNALFIMRQNDHSKYVANRLNISHRTVEAYKNHIREKLTVVSLDELLTMLRVRHEYTDLNW